MANRTVTPMPDSTMRNKNNVNSKFVRDMRCARDSYTARNYR